jgi:hydroxymethylpyrimidine pyrophosphatase-like HAD family hydrolase
MYQLIACDLDETLIGEDKQVSKENKLSIKLNKKVSNSLSQQVVVIERFKIP